ncbi:carbohydrate ABC transporter permease [Spirochaeta thermophila]|uniref:Transporter n=1 Tax=Winmispira thermophila (strain ATCC 49972 / DSM 6192 / RI 19.B1) TaxID=665571 RepID=E0RR25_WINT6|nr:sugar ABC transporter permease [Spirochaeta thermophila]ADN01603.1 transporter [Spirochaeta thermophila DSM 6192]
MKRELRIEEREALLGRRLILPALLVITGLIVYPIFYNIYLSFFDVHVYGANRFIGFKNYLDIVLDREFWGAFYTTIVYVIGTTLGTTLMGLLVALVMNREFPLRGLVRSLILLPYVAPLISVVFSWQFLFDPVNGIVMHTLVEQLRLLPERINLIGSPKNGIWVAVLFSIWKNFPFTYLMLLSRLQAIDQNLYEAAEIDGASALQKFWYLTLPELYFVMGAVILLRFIWNFNKFEEIFLLAPNVKVLSVYTYYTAFTGTLDLGKGAALAVVQFSILIIFILFYVRKVLKW